MATVLIESGACIGATSGMIANRGLKSATVADYNAITAAAESLADEVAASAGAVALADADNANMVSIVAHITDAFVRDRGYTGSTTDSDYAGIAAAICAAAKSAAPLV